MTLSPLSAATPASTGAAMSAGMLTGIPVSVITGLTIAAMAASSILSLIIARRYENSGGLSVKTQVWLALRHLLACLAVLGTVAALYKGSAILAVVGLAIYAACIISMIIELLKRNNGRPVQVIDIGNEINFARMLANQEAQFARIEADLDRQFPIHLRAPNLIPPDHPIGLPPPSQLPNIPDGNWRIKNGAFSIEGGGGVLQTRPVTAEEKRIALTGLIAALEQECSAFQGNTHAVNTLRTIMESNGSRQNSQELLQPLVEGYRIYRLINENVAQEQRDRTEAEQQSIITGLTALIEGLQQCSGAWVAHMQQMVDGFRGENISDPTWVQRLFAQKRLKIVQDHFRNRSQQVHFINQLRYLLWINHRIALPGAQNSSADWYVGHQNLTSDANILATHIRTAQTPGRLAYALRESLNEGANQARNLSIQTTLAQYRKNQPEFQTHLNNTCQVILTEALSFIEEAPISPVLRLSELEQESQIIQQRLTACLPWLNSVERLQRQLQTGAATEALVRESIESLQDQPLIPADIIALFTEENLRNLPFLSERLQRQIARAKITSNEYRSIEIQFQNNLRSLNQLRQEVAFCQELLGVSNSPVNEINTTNLHALISKLSELMQSHEGWPSFWAELINSPMNIGIANSLSSLINANNVNREEIDDFERIGLDRANFSLEVLKIVGPQLARRQVLEQFPNDQITLDGAFQVLEMCNLIEQR